MRVYLTLLPRREYLQLLAVFREQPAVRTRRITLLFQGLLGLGPTVELFGTEQAQMKRIQQAATISGDSYFRCRRVETIPHCLAGLLSRMGLRRRARHKYV